MPNIDIYGRTHELEPEVVEAMAVRLEGRRASSRYMSMLHDYLDRLDLKATDKVLVIGAGTGVEVREIIRRPGFGGVITALELSKQLVAVGQRKAVEEGVDDRIVWKVGDAHAIDAADACFDLVIAHTVISHVDAPDRVMAEARRVLRPGGTLVVFDGDYATYTFGTLDPEQGRLWDERIIRAMIANPRVMRTLPRVFRHLGLDLVDWRTYVLNEVGRGDFFLGSLRTFPVFLTRAGVATADEVQAYVDDQFQASENGAFFAGSNFVTYIARRPG